MVDTARRRDDSQPARACDVKLCRNHVEERDSRTDFAGKAGKEKSIKSFSSKKEKDLQLLKAKKGHAKQTERDIGEH